MSVDKISFWDIGEVKSEFDFESEKSKLLANLELLSSMTVEEQTLYKKWVELQESSSKRDLPSFARLYDRQWSPTDIYDLELTISEIENLDPYIKITETSQDATDWVLVRKMVSSMSWTANPGRNIKAFVLDRTSGKILGTLSIASDVTSLGARDNYIGWTKDNKFVDGKLNHTAIGSSIIPTQPLGYNFLGGKLISMCTTLPELRDTWKSKYGDRLVAVGTTSLYGVHSQYNGIPHFKTLGESKGMIGTKPDDEFYEPWHEWLKSEKSEWYDKNITQERIKNGIAMYGDVGRLGPVSGIKQKILAKIFKEIGTNPKDFHHGFKRGIYFAQMYDNGNEFLCNEIDESELKMKEKFSGGMVYVSKWWKRKAITRYKKLHQQNRLKPENLYYMDAIGITWEEMKSKYLKDVGR